MFAVAAVARGRRARAAAARSRRRGPLGATLLVAVGARLGSAGPSGRSTSSRPRPSSATRARRRRRSRADVHQILRPNTDPHEYEPAPARRARHADAKVVVVSGDGLDRWMGEVGGQAARTRGRRRVGAAPRRACRASVRTRGVALRPALVARSAQREAAVPEIRDALIRADPAAPGDVRAQRAAYVARVRGARRAASAACIGAGPAASRKLVTDHDAFGYFAHRYGIRVVGAVIPSQTTQAQPSAGRPREPRATLDRAASTCEAVFPESSVNRAAGARDRPRDRRALGPRRSTATRSARRARPAATYLGDGGRRTPTRWCAASPGAAAVPRPGRR